MDSQQLFYFNLIIGVLFLAYFIFGRAKQKPPTQLNMRAPKTKLDIQTDNPVLAKDQTRQAQISEPKQSILEPEMKPAAKPTKSLSIFFMYNGHDWEAHQVLGIPQGAGVEAATKAYQDLLKTSDPSSYDFLESAFNAIFKKRRNEKL